MPSLEPIMQEKKKGEKWICNDGPNGCSPYPKQVLVRLHFLIVDFSYSLQMYVNHLVSVKNTHTLPLHNSKNHLFPFGSIAISPS